MKFYQALKEHFGIGTSHTPLYRKVDWMTMGVTFLVAFIGYLITLAPDLTLEDCGELAVGSYYAGVPHPPGYPVWTIYTWLFTVLVPISNIAYRVAISSAFASALSCGVIALLISRGSSMLLDTLEETKEIAPRMNGIICALCGFVGGMIFGYNGFIWSQSVIVEVYTLSVLSLVTVMALMMRWMYAPTQRHYLYMAMFMFGICFTNHQSLLVAAMGLEMMVILINPTLGREMLMGNSVIFLYTLIGAINGKYANLNPEKAIFSIFIAVGIFSIIGYIYLAVKNKYVLKEWWHNIAAVFASGFAWLLANMFYFFMPISSMTNPPMNWGYARTVRGFFHALTRGQYESAKPTNDLLIFFDQVRVYTLGALNEFTIVMLLLALIPFLFLFFLKMEKKHKNRLFWISVFYGALFLLGLLVSLKNQVAHVPMAGYYAKSPDTYIGFFAGWIILMLVSTPFVYYKEIFGKFERIWLAGTTSVFFCLAILLLILLNPSSDKQSQDLHKVFFTASYVFFALWIGYGLAILLGFLCTRYERYREAFTYGAAIAGGFALYGVAATLSDSKNPLFITTAILGLLMTAALVVLFVLNRKKAPLKPIFIIVLFMPIYTVMAHWWDNEQRGHLFGFWYGHDMFTPPFEQADGTPLYPEMTKSAILYGGTDPGRFCPTYMIFCESFIPPQKRRDPKFDRRDVYIITQNALADEPYLDYIRAHYFRSSQVDTPFFSELVKTNTAKMPGIIGKPVDWFAQKLDNTFMAYGAKVEAKRRAQGVYPPQEIYTPSDIDFYNAYVSYMRDATERAEKGMLRPGEVYDPRTGTVSGQGAVMGINGLLTKVIFDQNPNNEFYVEESFALDWMYPYLTPYGIILKLNREPVVEFTQEIIDRDHEFWCKYMDRLCGNWITYDTSISELCDFAEDVYLKGDFSRYTGDMKFIRDNDAQKSFSKLRSAVTGLYWWRVNYAASTEEQQRLLKEAEFAGKQAFALCPFSPEALYKLVNVLAVQSRFEEAEKLAWTTLRFDPENRGIEEVIATIIRMREEYVRGQQSANIQQLENLYKADTNHISNTVALATAYLNDKRISEAQALLLDVMPRLKKLNDENPGDPENAMYLFATYTMTSQEDKAREVITNLLKNKDLSLTGVIAAAQAMLKIGDADATLSILRRAVDMAPDNSEILYDLAAIECILGDQAQSLEHLNHAIELNQVQRQTNPAVRDILSVLSQDQRFEKLRNDPNFPKK